MFVRLTFCKFLPEKINEARKIFTDEIIPTVRKQKGLVNIRLFEPVDKISDYISSVNGTLHKMQKCITTVGCTKSWSPS